MEVILVVFGSAKRVLGIPEDPILGIVFTRSGLKALAVEQVVMFLRKVGARAGPPIALQFPMHPLLVPVSHQRAYIMGVLYPGQPWRACCRSPSGWGYWSALCVSYNFYSFSLINYSIFPLNKHIIGNQMSFRSLNVFLTSVKNR